MSAATTHEAGNPGTDSRPAAVRRPFVPPVVENVGGLETQTLLSVILP